CGLRVPLCDVVELGVVLGLDPSIQFYPADDPPRDRAEIARVGRFRSRIFPGLTFATEVPLTIPGDLRAWDALVSIHRLRIGIEAETRIRDFQWVTRRL